jgi:hypothetical protein
MYSGHICAAGIELKTGKRIRPVLRSPLPASVLAVRGGVFDIANELDLGRTQSCGKYPEVEDTLFVAAAAKVKQTMRGEAFFDRIRNFASSRLDSIGPELVQEGTSLVTPPGKGRCSLVMTKALDPVRVTILPRRGEDGTVSDKIRFALRDGVELSVTDVRLYQRDMVTPDAERVRWLAERLAERPEVILCFGLGRPYNGRHYLPLNNLHLSNAPDWRLAPG